MFVYAGQPWATQKWARFTMDNAYRTGIRGLCGDEDVGQMSAWYILSAIGLHPVSPVDGVYIIGSPVFDKVTIRLDSHYYKGGHSRSSPATTPGITSMSNRPSSTASRSTGPGSATTKSPPAAHWNSSWAPSPTRRGRPIRRTFPHR